MCVAILTALPLLDHLTPTVKGGSGFRSGSIDLSAICASRLVKPQLDRKSQYSLMAYQHLGPH